MDIGSILKDPEFQGKSDDVRKQIIDGFFSRDSDFSKKDEKVQGEIRNQVYSIAKVSSNDTVSALKSVTSVDPYNLPEEAKGPLPGTSRFLKTIQPLAQLSIGAMLGPAGMIPVAGMLDPFFNQKIQDIAKEESKQYKGKTTEEAQIVDNQRKGKLTDVMNAVSQSTVGKMAYSLHSPEEWKEIRDITPPKYQYKPQSELLSDVFNFAADLPLYMLGGKTGKLLPGKVGGAVSSAGTFSVPAAIREIYDAKLEERLPTTIAEGFTDKGLAQLREVEKRIGVSVIKGIATGMALFGVKMGSNKLMTQAGIDKLGKLAPYAQWLADIPVTAATFTATDAALHDQPLSKENFEKNMWVMGILSMMHFPAWSKGAPIPGSDNTKLSPETKKILVDQVSKELGVERKEVYKAIASKDQAKIDDLMKSMSRNIDEKNLALSDRELAKAQRMYEENYSFEPVIEEVYPKGWDEVQKKTRRAYDTPTMQKVREDMDFVESNIWPMVKGDYAKLKHLAIDPTALGDYIDPTATGYKKLAPKFQKKIRDEISEMAQMQISDKYIEDTVDYQAQVEARKPYHELRDRGSQTYGQFTEPPHPGINELPTGVKPIVDKSVLKINTEKNLSLVGEQKPKLAEARMTMASDGEIITEPPVPKIQGVNPDLPIDIDYRTRISRRPVKDVVERQQDVYVTSIQTKVDKRGGESGRVLARNFMEKQRIEQDLLTGEAQSRYALDAIKSLKDPNGKINERIESAFVDLMRHGEIRRIPGEKPFTEEEISRAKDAHVKTRAIGDWTHGAAKEIGLQQFNRKVWRWTIQDAGNKFILRDERGQKIDTFTSKGDAVAFQERMMHSPLEYLKDHWYNRLDPEIMKNPVMQEELIQYWIDTGQIKVPEDTKIPAEEIRLMKRERAKRVLANELNIGEKRVGSQYSRDYEIPDKYLINKAWLYGEYLDDMWGRISKARVWGPKEEKLYNQVEAVRAEAFEKYDDFRAERISKDARLLADVESGRLSWDFDDHVMTNVLCNLQVLRKMPLSAIGQIPQRFYTAWRTNVTSMVKGMMALRGESKADMERLIMKAGVNTRLASRYMLEHMGSTSEDMFAKAAKGMLKKNKFVKTDMRNRADAASAAAFYVDFVGEKLADGKYSVSDGVLMKNGKPIEKGTYLGDVFYKDKWARQMESMGTDPARIVLQKGEITERQKLLAMNSVEVGTNFRGNPMYSPEFRLSTLGRLATQFGMFKYNMTKQFKDYIWKEAKFGNYQPLFYFSVVAGVAGVIPFELRSLITGAESNLRKMMDDGEILGPMVDYVMSSGELGMLDTALSMIKHGDYGFGPNISDFTRMIESLNTMYKTIKGNTKSAAEKATTLGKETLSTIAQQMPISGRFTRTIKLLTNKDVDVKPLDILTLPRDKVNPREHGQRAIFNKAYRERISR